MTEKTSVFGAALSKGKKPADNKPVDLKKVDEVAEGQGFVSRESHRRRNYMGPASQLNMKVPVDVYDRFVKFCDDQGDIPFRKGLEILLERAGL